MNANEIADKLQTIELMGYHDASIALTLAPIKLRQLQVENEARCISNKELHEEIWLLKDEVYRLKARLIKLKGVEK